MHAFTTQKDIRNMFWDIHPQFTRNGQSTQNSYPCDTRMAFVDFLDSLARSELISEKLANRATL